MRLGLEAGHTGICHDLVTVEGRGFGLPAEWGSLRSPENYVGYDRTEKPPHGPSSGSSGVLDYLQLISLPTLRDSRLFHA
jgi:hypothetical protein